MNRETINSIMSHESFKGELLVIISLIAMYYVDSLQNGVLVNDCNWLIGFVAYCEITNKYEC